MQEAAEAVQMLMRHTLQTVVLVVWVAVQMEIDLPVLEFLLLQLLTLAAVEAVQVVTETHQMVVMEPVV
jgi:hypothetical protein